MTLRDITKRFTFETKQSVGAAQNRAYDLNVSKITSEVVLLGLMDDIVNQASLVLDKLKVDWNELHHDLISAVIRPKWSSNNMQMFSGEISKIWENAAAEADALNHSQIGTEHILLGMLALPESPATVILSKHGVTLENARAAVRKLSTPNRKGK